MRLAFFLGEELLGIGSISEPVSRAYFCPTCGNIWARELVLDSETEHSTLSIHCPEHPRRYAHPATFTGNDYRYWVRLVPKEVLMRDFLYLCEQQ